jgi:hypothetical protein
VQILPGAPFQKTNLTIMLNAQDYLDKKLLKLGKELRELWWRQYISVPLEEPIQRGWRRIHVLTAKSERRADKDVLLALLKVMGTVQFHNTPEFRIKRGRGRRRRFMEREQPLRELTVGEWDRRDLPETWESYFRLEKRYSFCAWRDTLVFTNPYAFELKIEPNWVTELYTSDPAVEERIAEIEGWLRNRNAKYRLEWLCGYSNHWHEPRRKDLIAKIAKRELREAMRNPWEVDPGASTRRVRLSLRRRIFIFSWCSPMQRQRAQTSFSAGAS